MQHHPWEQLRDPAKQKCHIPPPAAESVAHASSRTHDYACSLLKWPKTDVECSQPNPIRLVGGSKVIREQDRQGEWLWLTSQAVQMSNVECTDRSGVLSHAYGGLAGEVVYPLHRDHVTMQNGGWIIACQTYDRTVAGASGKCSQFMMTWG